MPGFPWEPHTPGKISVGQFYAPQSREGTGAGTPPPQFSATVTIPIWQWFLTRFGKKTAVYIGISVSGAEGVGPGLAWGLLLGAPQLTHLPTPTLLVSSAISHALPAETSASQDASVFRAWPDGTRAT